MIAPAATQFLNESNAGIAEEAARVAEATAHAEALRDLKQRVRAAASDGQLDASELDAIEAEARRLGVEGEVAPILDALRGALVGGSVSTDEVSDAFGDLERAIGTEIRTALADARPSLEMQLRIQADQIATQLFSATSQTYHRTAMNIIANMKA